jgi:superfamily II DNA or RNA helicase
VTVAGNGIGAETPAGLATGNLRGKEWSRFLRGPDPELLERLYVPALSEAVRYDRCCAYFSCSVLAAAARGFGKLIERLEGMGDRAPRPAIRLVVNEELTEEDVRALMETGDLTALEAQLKKRFKTPRDALERARLQMLAWMAKRGLLAVRVGIMRRGGGLLHAKFGIATDERGDAIVFRGSGNESAQGLVANFEQLEVSTSWEDPAAHQYYSAEFEALWKNGHPDVHTVSLPEAIRLQLIKYAPKKPPTIEPLATRGRQEAAMVWHFLTEAPYLAAGETACDAPAMVDVWPHQRRVVEETAAAWPEGRLLCDEVGMGKTIEAILVLRRLMAGRGVRRVLVLLPAGLVKQWQGELREKGGMVFPRLEGINTLVWPDERVERVAGLAESLQRDFLLMSRETARTEGNLSILMDAPVWDLVLLDESHAARRRKQEEGEFNAGTLLLALLRELQLRRRARGFLLLSATPMQTHPWEPWDLLSVLGEGGEWLAEFGGVRHYYGAIAALNRGTGDLETARRAARLVAADARISPPPLVAVQNLRDTEGVAKALVFATPGQKPTLGEWLRRESPLARRMHRNTRATLRQYHAKGLLANPPPKRLVEDLTFDYRDPAERRVYDAVTGYIEKRFRELEHEKPGKGFVMTIYRRRAASSPVALERSLERRRQGMMRVAERMAFDREIGPEEGLDPRDQDDLPEGEALGRVSAALPEDPAVARAELAEVERLISDVRSLGATDSKRSEFFDVLRRATDDGRAVLVFTEYTDTMEYIREALVPFYGGALGCYSGDGGQRWVGTQWAPVSKDAITRALHAGELRVLVCTDAASEGLNLQAAGAVINYDLPWNPSKVEQRIGRIDRIGQKLPEIRVINLFLRHSVDEQVYRVLRARCGLFEHFVGAMQPVLARARRMLLGQDGGAPAAVLGNAAHEVEQDPLAQETYMESGAEAAASPEPAMTRSDLEEALRGLGEEMGVKVAEKKADRTFVLSGAGVGRCTVSTVVQALETDHGVLPLTPESEVAHALATQLRKAGERLPLVIGSHSSGPFRASVALWIGPGTTQPVKSIHHLRDLVKSWSGDYPEPGEWLAAQEAATGEARRLVAAMEARAAEREPRGLRAQVEAARARLLRELGRYLACLEQGTSDLNGLLYQQMLRETAGAQRLRQALEKLRGYPDWPPDLCRELDQFVQEAAPNQRKARLLGKELDAALQDPRWHAALAL